MNKTLLIIFLLSTLTLFQGCGSSESERKSPDLANIVKKNITIQKNGDIRLERIEEILTASYLSEYATEHLSENGRYRLYLAGYQDKASLNDLRLAFYIFGDIGGAILSPCSSTKVYDNVENTYDTSRERYEEFQPTLQDMPISDENQTFKSYVYFDIKKLQNLGFITQKQEDLCLFNEYIVYDEDHSLSDDTGTKYLYKSNKLRYKAKEINRIVKKYEEMI